MAWRVPRKRRRLNGIDGLEGPPNLDGPSPHLTKPQQQQPQKLEDSVVNKAMSIVLIATEVFNFLSVKDLATCSRVNRTWSIQAREYLREKRKFIARIKFWCPCAALQELNGLLEFSHNTPINGLFIFTNEKDHHYCINSPGDDLNVSDLYSVLLRKLNVKYLQIHWSKESTCPAVQLIEKLFKDRSENLIELTLLRLPPTIKSLVSHFEVNLETRENWLPNLVTIELPRGEAASLDVHTTVANELIFATPRLNKIIGHVLPACLEHIVQKGKTGAVQELALRSNSNYTRRDIADKKVEEYLKSTLKFAKQKLRLKSMVMSTSSILALLGSDFRDEQLDLISSILKALLKSSCNDLQYLRIGQLDLILLCSSQMAPDSEPLSLVKHLTIDYCGFSEIEEHYCTLRQTDFQTMFPYLQSVELCPVTFLTSLIYVGNEFVDFLDPVDYSCTTVTKLKIVSRLESAYLNWKIDYLMRHLASIFPNVKSFRIDKCKNLEGYCSALWTTWPNIENIMFTEVSGDSVKKNLDSCFTGLTTRECKSLREGTNYESSDESADEDEIISIRNLTKLKKFRIDIVHRDSEPCQQNSSNNSKEVFLSEVTGWLAFLEMPQLTVEIARGACHSQGDCCFALKHLQPFVKLVDVDSDADRLSWRDIDM